MTRIHISIVGNQFRFRRMRIAIVEKQDIYFSGFPKRSKLARIDCNENPSLKMSFIHPNPSLVLVVLLVDGKKLKTLKSQGRADFTNTNLSTLYCPEDLSQKRTVKRPLLGLNHDAIFSFSHTNIFVGEHFQDIPVWSAF